MPTSFQVDFRHPQYESHADEWKLCRDVIAGEKAVKKASTEYLPMLEGQEAGDYEAYKLRAAFHNATAKAVNGFQGALFTTSPSIVVPASMAEKLTNIGSEEEPLIQILSKAAKEVIKVGRCGLLVDAQESGGNPYVCLYMTESIINWKTVIKDGQKVLSLVVLEEICYEDDPEDPFGIVESVRWRVLRLDDAGFYVVDVYEKIESESDKAGQKKFDFRLVGQYTPTKIGGGRLDYIPFVFINPSTITPDVEVPPIYDLACLNVSHYRTSADLEWGRHYAALPTPVIFGASDTTVLTIGSKKAWSIPNPQAKAEILEVKGPGLASLETALTQKEKQMAILAARFLEPQKNQTESGKSIRMRMAGDVATLAGVAEQLGAGGTQLLQILADWMLVQENVLLVWHQDFAPYELSMNELLELAQLVDMGKVPFADMLDMLKRSNIVPPERTIEQHTKMIEEQKLPVPPLGPVKIPLPGDDPKKEDPPKDE